MTTRVLLFHVCVVAPLMLALALPQVEQVKVYTKPTLTVRAFPRMQTVNIAQGCSAVQLMAELKGPEDERWYCPRVTWEKPDSTRAVEESDCPPFEERNDCYPKLPMKCSGWHRDQAGNIIDNSDQPGCECNIVGYPRSWRLNLCYPDSPYNGEWEVWVRLEKNQETLARVPVSFYIK